MLDINTLDARWTLGLGLPIIAALLVLTWRRSRALATRIRDVREEMARHPQDPYAALAALHSKEDRPKQSRRKDTGRARWRKD